jgi:nucleoside-diphosphate-sugar epimerase
MEAATVNTAADKTYLITGGASLIGSHVAHALLAAGAAGVRLLDNFALGTPNTIGHLMDGPRVQLIHGNVLRPNELLDASQGTDGMRVRNGNRPVIIGDGREVHDYIHVTYIAAGCVAAMISKTHGEVMDLATGIDTSLTEVVRTVLKVLGSTLEPEYRPDTRVVRSAGGTYLGLSRAGAEEAIGWLPRVTLEDGIRPYIGWLEERGAELAVPAFVVQ